MKTGGKVRVWPEGEKSRATTGKVVITSENGRSLAIGFGDPA